jgi:hypothetical protein
MANAMLDPGRKAVRIVVTSKWNKIEHRRFSFITGNWRRLNIQHLSKSL